MKSKLIFLTVFAFNFSVITHAQVAANQNNFWYAREFSKDVALYYSKEFLFKNVLGASTEVVQF